MDEQVLVCFGDSNTHGSPPWTGVPAPRYGPDVRWPGVLAAALGPSWRVHEEGLPGRTTVHPDPVEGGHLSGLAALPVVLGTHSPIDVLVIMLGTNDLKARFAVGPAEIATSVERLVLCRTRVLHGDGPAGAADPVDRPGTGRRGRRRRGAVRRRRREVTAVGSGPARGGGPARASASWTPAPTSARARWTASTSTRTRTGRWARRSPRRSGSGARPVAGPVERTTRRAPTRLTIRSAAARRASGRPDGPAGRGRRRRRRSAAAPRAASRHGR